MALNRIVGLVGIENADYPKASFNPGRNYPEFMGNMEIDEGNLVYGAVREMLYSLGFDKENFGKKGWNPLKGFIKKGDKVVIKPNLVFDRHPLGKVGVEAMITHASVIRPIIDYVILATDGDCGITICDVPLQGAVWENLVKRTGLLELVDFYKKKGVRISLLDLRLEIAVKNSSGIIIKREKKIRDPKGYIAVNLNKNSYIQDIIKDYKKLEITDYGTGTVGKHHNPDKNEYLIPRTILEADVFINVPKLKTHKKAGVTLSMKNLVGINGDKSWIAHHRRGVDEYQKFVLKDFLKWKFAYYLKAYAPKFITSFAFKVYKRVFLGGQDIKKYTMKHGSMIMEGNWHGNDTIWRTILDLNNILFFADKKGVMKSQQQRRYLTIIDGIIGMEKEGPMDGLPKHAGMLIGGFHPVAVDFAAASVMGFDYKKIPQIKEAFKEKYFGMTDFAPEDVKIVGNIDASKLNLKFAPSKGWKGFIEKD